MGFPIDTKILITKKMGADGFESIRIKSISGIDLVEGKQGTIFLDHGNACLRHNGSTEICEDPAGGTSRPGRMQVFSRFTFGEKLLGTYETGAIADP